MKFVYLNLEMKLWDWLVVMLVAKLASRETMDNGTSPVLAQRSRVSPESDVQVSVTFNRSC